MQRTTMIPVALACLVGAACASHPQDSATTASGSPERTDELTERAQAGEAAPVVAGGPVYPTRTLRRALQAAITEVVLDPRGQSAVTLDAGGGAGLWTSIDTENPALPIALPVTDVAWVSIARAGGAADSDFVVATIDTAGGTRIGRVTTNGANPTWTTTFENPASDAMFEVHVLDGGDRILALGVDHRIHLWTRDGRSLSTLDNASFVAWQLRVAQPSAETTNIVAVLGQPVRAQRIVLEGDRLQLSGPARELDMDRGPNRSDLIMSPDGRHVAVLRRPKSRSKRFDLEVTALDTGLRRIVAGESDMRRRPRMHAIDDARVLMETGSGAGFFVAFDAGAPWDPPAPGPDQARASTDDLPLTPFTMAALPASTVESARHSTVVAGVRVVPQSRGLTVAPIGDGPHRTFESASFSPTAVALDQAGERALWGTKEAIYLEDLTGTAAVRSIVETPRPTALLGFANGDRIVAVDDSGAATLRELTTATVIDTAKLDVGWGIAASGWRVPSSGAGQIALASTSPRAPTLLLEVTAAGFGETTSVPAELRHTWPEAGKPPGQDSAAWLQSLDLDLIELGLREKSVVVAEPSPGGDKLAIVQKVRHVEGWDEAGEAFVVGPHGFVITMVDRTHKTRLWTRASTGLNDLAWSGDGQKLGFVDEAGGAVCDAATGDVLLTRRDLGLTVVQ